MPSAISCCPAGVALLQLCTLVLPFGASRPLRLSLPSAPSPHTRSVPAPQTLFRRLLPLCFPASSLLPPRVPTHPPFLRSSLICRLRIVCLVRHHRPSSFYCLRARSDLAVSILFAHGRHCSLIDDSDPFVVRLGFLVRPSTLVELFPSSQSLSLRYPSRRPFVSSYATTPLPGPLFVAPFLVNTTILRAKD